MNCIRETMKPYHRAYIQEILSSNVINQSVESIFEMQTTLNDSIVFISFIICRVGELVCSGKIWDGLMGVSQSWSPTHILSFYLFFLFFLFLRLGF